MLQLPQSEKSMFTNYNLRMYEDLSAYKARIKIVHTKMVTDQTLNMVISVPNFEASSFKMRHFQLCFENKLPEG